MKYLVKNEKSNDAIFISGETKKEIIIRTIQEYLTDKYVDGLIDGLMDFLELNYDLTFIDITNTKEL